MTKPGARAGSTALEQCRAQGRWPTSYDRFWEVLRQRQGKQEGARSMIEVLLLPVGARADAGAPGGGRSARAQYALTAPMLFTSSMSTEFFTVSVSRNGSVRCELIHRLLLRGGKLSLFEINPRNPGARMVMKRIPLDREAIMISPREARRLVSDAGFRKPMLVRSLFYFPRPLAFLRRTENSLAHLPLGAQYCVLAEK